MRKIAVALSKGGVGKTTTAVHIAARLAEKGKKVLLVDADTQAQCSTMLGVRPNAGLAEVLTGELSPERAMVQIRENLTIIAGGRNLAGAQNMIVKREAAGERVLAEALSTIDSEFEYIILDTAPSWGALNINVMMYAEELVIPALLESITLFSIVEFNKILQSVKQFNSKLEVRYVVPTKLNRRNRQDMEVLEQLIKAFDGKVTYPIRTCIRLSEAAGKGKLIWDYWPRATAAEDYDKLVERILKDA